MECGTDATMIVHVKTATEILLDDLGQVGVGFLSGQLVS